MKSLNTYLVLSQSKVSGPLIIIVIIAAGYVVNWVKSSQVDPMIACICCFVAILAIDQVKLQYELS